MVTDRKTEKSRPKTNSRKLTGESSEMLAGLEQGTQQHTRDQNIGAKILPGTTIPGAYIYIYIHPRMPRLRSFFP